jgi:trans-aconitate 2-methyltransferase
MSSWNPTTYAGFRAERRRPVEDLIARLPRADYASIADLGCGSGQSTEPLAERFPDARLYGIDSSEPMIAAARQRLPGISFDLGEIALWSDRSVELAFSNAALQWVCDHIAVMARIASELPAGGCIAAQFPDNLDEPSHALMREVAELPRFRHKLAAQAADRQQIGAFADYDAALAPHCVHVDIWRTTYVHRLESPEAIVSWVEGSGLRPYLEPLDAGEREVYLGLYGAAIAKAYPRRPWGGVLLPFPRLFVVAAR